tara:strand:- start:948 stop:1184 length:237 start_codon:yes stop_codon:yes gene_type:complete
VPPCISIGDFMKNIKVIFRGNKTPSGKNSNVEYFIGAKKLENLKADGRFDIEIVDMPQEKPKAKPKPKKTKKKVDIDE